MENSNNVHSVCSWIFKTATKSSFRVPVEMLSSAIMVSLQYLTSKSESTLQLRTCFSISGKVRGREISLVLCKKVPYMRLSTEQKVNSYAHHWEFCSGLHHYLKHLVFFNEQCKYYPYMFFSLPAPDTILHTNQCITENREKICILS